MEDPKEIPPVRTSIVEPTVTVTDPATPAPYVRRKPARVPMLMVNKLRPNRQPHMSKEVEEGDRTATTSTPVDATKKIKPSGMSPVVPGATGGAASYPDPGPSGQVTTRPAPGGTRAPAGFPWKDR